MNRKETKVMVFGTFDIIHPGHLNFFSHAKRKGTHLTVVVATDDNAEEIKGKKPIYTQKERAEKLLSLPMIDKVVLGEKKDKFRVIREEKPEIICLGYDQKIKKSKLKEQLKERGLKTKVLRLGFYKKELYKSSIIKNKYNL